MLALEGVVLTDARSSRPNELDTRSLVADGFDRQVEMLAVNEIQSGVDRPQTLVAVSELVGLAAGSRHLVRGPSLRY